MTSLSDYGTEISDIPEVLLIHDGSSDHDSHHRLFVGGIAASGQLGPLRDRHIQRTSNVCGQPGDPESPGTRRARGALADTDQLRRCIVGPRRRSRRACLRAAGVVPRLSNWDAVSSGCDLAVRSLPGTQP